MGGSSRTADGRRRWRQWTEPEAREALAEFAQSGESLAGFARRREVSSNRLRYWRKRLGEVALVPSFVQIGLPGPIGVGARADGVRIELLVDDVSVRVPVEMEVGRLAALVRALAGREPVC